MRRLSLLPLVLLAGACGDTGDKPTSSRPPAAATPAPSPAPGAAADRHEPTIRAWSDAVRRGDVRRAAEFFVVPVIVSQGRTVRLRSVADVRAFNASLPCGARLTDVAREGRYVVGTFRLTERPGRKCDAPGAVARVAFVFAGDRIREWRQVPDSAEAPPAPGETT